MNLWVASHSLRIQLRLPIKVSLALSNLVSTFPDSFLTTTSTSLELYASATLHWLLIPLHHFPLTCCRVFLTGYSLELFFLISYCFSWLSYFLSDYNLNVICSWKLSRIPRGGNSLHREQEICPYILRFPHQSTYRTLWVLLVSLCRDSPF